MARRNARNMREAERVRRRRKKRLVVRKDAMPSFIKRITEELKEMAEDDGAKTVRNRAAT